MGMELKLNLKMTQKLVMTPMLQQAIKLLPLARLELAQLVHQEIIENPVLEEILEEDTDEEPLPESLDGELDAASDLEGLEMPEISEPLVQEAQSHETENPKEQEMEWEEYFQDNYEPHVPADFANEAPSIEATCKKDPTLHDHLHWQLNLSVDSDEDKFAGACIIGNIQNDGYLNADLEEIAQVGQIPLDRVERVLQVIQSFEPAGVGARDLRECLLLQVQAMPEPDSLLITLIETHLDHLDQRHYPKIANALKISVEDLLALLESLRELDPKPGFQFQSEGFDYIVPDLIVVLTDEGYEVLLNDEGVPKVRISSYYHDLLKSTSEEQTKEYLESKYRAAQWLIKSIDQRRQTIYKVGKSIVKLQTEFLEKGLSYLKPMVLRDVAQDIEMHESTVSRITTNKYIDTPQGIFELKFFFHSGIKSYMGDNNLSSIRVKNMIQEIISQENPKKPYTDDEVVELLMKKNAKIARRTVTKYRKELNIPAASKRKKLF
ncbi:MAG: RNA polymerase factor sigma-54 [Nitrospina sp.]|nr:RNA polymerase factor sigma-54 [Nitrospina sp.]